MTTRQTARTGEARHTRQLTHPTPQQALGAYGERVAQAHLCEQGMEVLDRNWHGSAGELDLLLRDGHVLVACEVKTRSGDTGGAPHEAVTPAKVERMMLLVEEWQRLRGVTAQDVRLDLVAVWHPSRGAARVEHVRGLV